VFGCSLQRESGGNTSIPSENRKRKRSGDIVVSFGAPGLRERHRVDAVTFNERNGGTHIIFCYSNESIKEAHNLITLGINPAHSNNYEKAGFAKSSGNPHPKHSTKRYHILIHSRRFAELLF
jgi:hypothetical protein